MSQIRLTGKISSAHTGNGSCLRPQLINARKPVKERVSLSICKGLNCSQTRDRCRFKLLKLIRESIISFREQRQIALRLLLRSLPKSISFPRIICARRELQRPNDLLRVSRSNHWLAWKEPIPSQWRKRNWWWQVFSTFLRILSKMTTVPRKSRESALKLIQKINKRAPNRRKPPRKTKLSPLVKIGNRGLSVQECMTIIVSSTSKVQVCRTGREIRQMMLERLSRRWIRSPLIICLATNL